MHNHLQSPVHHYPIATPYVSRSARVWYLKASLNREIQDIPSQGNQCERQEARPGGKKEVGGKIYPHITREMPIHPVPNITPMSLSPPNTSSHTHRAETSERPEEKKRKKAKKTIPTSAHSYPSFSPSQRLPCPLPFLSHTRPLAPYAPPPSPYRSSHCSFAPTSPQPAPAPGPTPSRIRPKWARGSRYSPSRRVSTP